MGTTDKAVFDDPDWQAPPGTFPYRTSAHEDIDVTLAEINKSLAETRKLGEATDLRLDDLENRMTRLEAIMGVAMMLNVIAWVSVWFMAH